MKEGRGKKLVLKLYMILPELTTRFSSQSKTFRQTFQLGTMADSARSLTHYIILIELLVASSLLPEDGMDWYCYW